MTGFSLEFSYLGLAVFYAVVGVGLIEILE